jgi:mannose-6-phosphate isomerase-like protein (cupin superfamily)
MEDRTPSNTAAFDLRAIAANFPATAATMLIDTRLTDEVHASARVFRVYSPVPAHYHITCDEYLLVLAGRAEFFFGDDDPFELGPGQLIFFRQSIVHGIPKILEEPVVVLAVDTPRRDPTDVHFVDPTAVTAETFIPSRTLY